MANLGTNNYNLIAGGVRTLGTYNPAVIMNFIGEYLTTRQYDKIEKFLQWVHDNDKKFGSANYKAVYAEYEEAN